MPLVDPQLRARLLALARGEEPGVSAQDAPAPRVDSQTLGRALFVVALVAAAISLLVLWRSQSSSPAPVAFTPGPSAITASASPSAAAEVVVQIVGAVRDPGVLRLPPGSRVIDAIEAAGGLKPGHSTGQLNLARRLVDGEQIAVDAKQSSIPNSASPSATTGRVDLNTADAVALEALPDIGPVTAAAILAWRTDHGRFSAVEQLREVSGIGPKTYEQLAPLVTVDGVP